MAHKDVNEEETRRQTLAEGAACSSAVEGVGEGVNGVEWQSLPPGIRAQFRIVLTPCPCRCCQDTDHRKYEDSIKIRHLRSKIEVLVAGSMTSQSDAIARSRKITVTHQE